jgi:hypothetical protein
MQNVVSFNTDVWLWVSYDIQEQTTTVSPKSQEQITLKNHLKPTSKKSIRNILNTIKLSKQSGFVIYRQAKNSEILLSTRIPHLCVLYVSRNQQLSLHNINGRELARRSDYCAVRAESLKVIRFKFHLQRFNVVFRLYRLSNTWKLAIILILLTKIRTGKPQPYR